MPIYAYHCDRCDTKFEFFQHFTDDPKIVCPDCETPTLRKLFEPTPVHYKGCGYYVTDKKRLLMNIKTCSRNKSRQKL